ncbi:hypothetical protein H4S01_004523, partial [Coemansia sp. RSA 2610]
RDMLEELEHPFIVNLRFSWQDEYAMFMVMDLMMGGDLRFHIMRRRFFEGMIKFWIAELACAVHHLHAVHRIVHRDIKPDNILLDSDGHIGLSDFNIATRIVDGAPHYAVAGTANYMAPEVISGAGYTFSVDWWSLGVVMYECVYGRRPFRHKKNSDALRHAVLYEEIQFPLVADVQVSYDCISVMRGLLAKDPTQRMGFSELKAHSFFGSIDWDRLEARQVVPPFTPSTDQSNFDISHDLEEMLLEPEPLTESARRRGASKRTRTPPEHATPEYRHIADGFAAFDFFEYEQFKAYLDAHGSISALAMEDARAASIGTAITDTTLLAVPTLAQIKLDDRPIINLDSQSTLSYSVTLSRSRTVLQQQQTIVTNAPDANVSFADLPTQTSLRQRISDARRRGSSGARDRRPSDLRLPTGPTALSSATNSSCATMAAAPSPEQSVLSAHPGTLEPPSVVPIDILTWNQLLPSQRSLAHRYCIKMAHDRIRRSGGQSRPSQPAWPQQYRKGSQVHEFPKLSAHRHTPSAAARVQSSHRLAESSSSKSSLRKRSSAELLSTKEKRVSLLKRQFSADNLAAANPSASYLPLDMSVRGLASDMLAPMLSSSHYAGSSAFSSTHDDYYRSQPLPLPPASSKPVLIASSSHHDVAGMSLADAPRCPLPPPPSLPLSAIPMNTRPL